MGCYGPAQQGWGWEGGGSGGPGAMGFPPRLAGMRGGVKWGHVGVLWGTPGASTPPWSSAPRVLWVQPCAPPPSPHQLRPRRDPGALLWFLDVCLVFGCLFFRLSFYHPAIGEEESGAGHGGEGGLSSVLGLQAEPPHCTPSLQGLHCLRAPGGRTEQCGLPSLAAEPAPIPPYIWPCVQTAPLHRQPHCSDSPIAQTAPLHGQPHCTDSPVARTAPLHEHCASQTSPLHQLLHCTNTSVAPTAPPMHGRPHCTNIPVAQTPPLHKQPHCTNVPTAQTAPLLKQPHCTNSSVARTSLLHPKGHCTNSPTAQPAPNAHQLLHRINVSIAPTAPPPNSPAVRMAPPNKRPHCTNSTICTDGPTATASPWHTPCAARRAPQSPCSTNTHPRQPHPHCLQHCSPPPGQRLQGLHTGTSGGTQGDPSFPCRSLQLPGFQAPHPHCSDVGSPPLHRVTPQRCVVAAHGAQGSGCSCCAGPWLPSRAGSFSHHSAKFTAGKRAPISF